ncbi:MAG: ABC transporter ATP-binding protein [Acholeplasmataceae bacterium]|nr:MAG: ABC transporter ATP-binding protein [Acholeplasmataceae bacterium]
MQLAVKTNELIKSFNGLKAVNHLNLEVPVGAIYGFLGPNGSGKTTTLKMLTGMTEPTAGSIEIMGEPMVFGKQKSHDNIGFLPDVPGFYDWMNAQEFLVLCGSLFHIPKAVLSTRVTGLLKVVGLSKSAKKKIGTFSRGMKQRLGIAQALINNPDIIFLDEPVSALDPQGRKEVMDIIHGLKGKVTVFFSTHILSDVERICDRVIIINEGAAVLEDTIENIKAMSETHAIEIEADVAVLNKIEALLQDIEHVMNIKTNHQTMVVTVDDLDVSRKHIYRILHEHDMMVKKIMVKEPTLEDIYMKVVNHHG